MWNPTKSARTMRWSALVVSLALLGGLLWLDFATEYVDDYVVLPGIVAGLAAGVVAVLFTTMQIEKTLSRGIERMWEPAVRLALTDILQALADEHHSDFSRGLIIARSVPRPRAKPENLELFEELGYVRKSVLKSQTSLTAAMSRWVQLLASHRTYEPILDQITSVSTRLDSIRDLTLEREISPESIEFSQALKTEIIACNESFMVLIDDIKIALRI